MKVDMKINQTDAIKRAKQTGISPYLQIKRNINYRKSESKAKCRNCNSVLFGIYKDCDDKLSCQVIGISRDSYAFVEEDHICDMWEKNK